MRICEPQNQFGQKLVSVADFTNVSLRLEKTLDSTGIITITAEDISDIELWEVSSVAVKIDSQYENILPETFRNTDGSLSIRFFEATETVDFSKAVVILKHTTVDGIITKVITIEMKIAALMAKTIADSKKPDYDASANVAEWKALGVEAKTTEPDNYPYADCSTAAELTTAGFDLNATTIGKDVCLISFDAFNNDGFDARTFPNVLTFEADLPSLVDGTYAFGALIPQFASKIQTFSGRFPNVQNASYMFQYCTGLTEWSVDLPSGLTSANSMFQGCTGLTEWIAEMPSVLSSANSMFAHCSGLTEWTVELPSGLSDASSMFSSCTSLTEWTVDLPSGLPDTRSMFNGCTGLTKWTAKMPSELSNASYMFKGCTSLTKWTAELPSGLSNASYMFQNCSNLTEFSVNMPSGLSNASYMFSGCKLNKASVQKIADSIPTVSGTHNITIGIDSTQITQAEQNAFNTTIVNKGWTVTWERN